MGYTACTEKTELRLSGSPSHRVNNVTVSTQGLVAYIDRAKVRLEELGQGCIQESSVVVPPGEPSVIMQVKFVTVDCVEYLAVTSCAGVAIYDTQQQNKLVTSLSIDKVPENEENDTDPTRSDFLWAVEGLQGSRLVAVGSSNGTIVVCDVSLSRKKMFIEQALFGHRRPVTALASSVTHLVSGDDSGQVNIWNNGTFELHCQFPSVGQPCTSVAIRGDIAVASYVSGVVRIYNLTWSRIFAEIDAHCRAINSMDLNLQHNVFATAGEDGFINVWQLPSKHREEIELVSSHHFENSLLVGVSFSKALDNKYYAVAYDEKVLSILT